jgi:hypothetical protein
MSRAVEASGPTTLTGGFSASCPTATRGPAHPAVIRAAAILRTRAPRSAEGADAGAGWYQSPKPIHLMLKIQPRGIGQ